jgi:uncharacterized protein
MAITKKEKLNNVLLKLDEVGDIIGSAVVSRDGLLVSLNFKSGLNADTFAAMSATMFAAAETAFLEINMGDVIRVITESKKGKLIAMGAGTNAVVVILVNPNANLGLILIELNKVSEEIKNIME